MEMAAVSTKTKAGFQRQPMREELMERARALVPVLRERAAKAEELRHIPDETIADLVASEIPRICQPSRYGGFDMGWDVVCEVSMELARGDGSQGWVANIFTEHNYLAGLFPDKAQQEVWGNDPTTLVSASFPPQGNKVERVEGGYLLDGRWAFSSGVRHAGWTIFGELVQEKEGRPQHYFFLVPARDRKVIDDWYSVGMTGTGSDTIELREVFVPEHRALPNRLVAAGQSPGAQVNPAPVFRHAVQSLRGRAVRRHLSHQSTVCARRWHRRL